MAIGTAVALLSKCTIEVERPNKQTINVSEAITNTTEDIAKKIKNAADEFKNMKSNITGKDTTMADAIDTFGADNMDTANIKVEDTFKQ
jgi:hypothetical protein